MDKNFIKDNRVFPEEMHGSSKKNTSTNTENHTTSIVWWIVGLLALLCVVFFIGLWAGKKTSYIVQERDNEEAQEERQDVVNSLESFRAQATPEERNQRLRTFFAE